MEKACNQSLPFCGEDELLLALIVRVGMHLDQLITRASLAVVGESVCYPRDGREGKSCTLCKFCGRHALLFVYVEKASYILEGKFAVILIANLEYFFSWSTAGFDM